MVLIDLIPFVVALVIAIAAAADPAAALWRRYRPQHVRYGTRAHPQH